MFTIANFLQYITFYFLNKCKVFLKPEDAGLKLTIAMSF